MARLNILQDAIEWTHAHQTLRIECCGNDALRVRATLWPEFAKDRVNALLPADPETDPVILEAEGVCSIQNGAISARLNGKTGDLTFLRDETVILREKSSYLVEQMMPARRLKVCEGELLDIAVDFESDPHERFMGLGQNPNGQLNQKGNRIEFRQRNGVITVPFLVSSRGYGLFWNNPGLGEVSLDAGHTLWRAKGSIQLDYWITVGDTQADIIRNYTKATGLPPKMPDWATGFWQSRLRYGTRDELETVAKTHLEKDYPLSVIVIDYFHWSKQGEWTFNSPDWPDPSSMVSNLEDAGIKTMVSIWPTVNPKAKTFEEMAERGLLVRCRDGSPLLRVFVERDEEGPAYLGYYDATNAEAREYIWQRCVEGYYRHGIKVWWLDACEPELYPESHENAVYSAGAASAVTNAYPLFNARAFYEGMKSQGEDEIVLLCRSAWAGSQRYGALVWSGDVHSDFQSLAHQIKLGLNMAASGISWWTSDIGGFSKGLPEDPEFRELLVRWFQFSVFCPVCRLHGWRQPGDLKCGAPNELWSFGAQVEALLAEQLQHREKLRSYVGEQMERYSKDGTPVMRSLGAEFPNDPEAAHIEDAYMFGDDLYVAPVTEYGVRSRRVYLPENANWSCYWEGSRLKGGRWVTVDAPLNKIPVFRRQKSD